MSPRVSFAVHEAIPPGVIVRDHFTALDIMHSNGNVIDLGPETISQGIPLFPKLMRKKGVDFSETGVVGLVIARVIGKSVRAGGNVNSFSQAPEPSVEAITVKGIKHIVKDRIVLMTKLAQLIEQGRWNLKAV
jgi:6-phosphogluconate dehydrogenase (decarboxylating)